LVKLTIDIRGSIFVEKLRTGVFVEKIDKPALLLNSRDSIALQIIKDVNFTVKNRAVFLVES